MLDDSNDNTPIDLFLHRLALLPSADNRAPRTESQVFRRVLDFDFVGVGFDVDAPLVEPIRETTESVDVGAKRARDE
jgi:hypothetical protein